MSSKQNRTQGRKKTPVSSHPLFPAIVALWFGALFGLGSLAVRPSLLESLVLSSHLDVIVPMTAPPLGMTARILLALTMAVIGVATGAIIARRIARPKPVKRQRRRNAAADTGKARGFGATTLSEPPLRQPEPEAAPETMFSGRRRSLAVAEEEREDYRLHAAPLPGGAPEIFDVTQIDMSEPAAAAPVAQPEFVAPAMAETRFAEPAPEVQPLELSGYAQPEQAVLAQSYHNVLARTETQSGDADGCLELDASAEMPDHRQIFGQSQAPLSAPAAVAAPEPEHAFAAPPPVAAPNLDIPVMTAPEPHSPLRRFDSPAQPAAFAPPVSAPAAPVAMLAPEPAPEPTPAPAPQARLVLPQDSAAQRIATANLAELSPVELIERFALALRQRRASGPVPAGLAEAAASFAAPEAVKIPEAYVAPEVAAPFTPPAAAAVPEPLGEPQQPRIPAAFTDAETGEVIAIPAPSPLSLPAALRPIDFSDFDEPDDDHGHVPPRSISMPAAAAPQPSEPAVAAIEAESEVEAEPDVLEEGYSSLLDLNRPAPLRQTFVRIEEAMSESAPIEPVVIFPGQDARAGMRFALAAEVAAPAASHAVPAAPGAPAVAEAPEVVTNPDLAANPVSAASNVRRFDAPNAAGPAAGLAAAPVAAPAQDPAEAERALRSALATLQRMSGAA